MKSHHWIHMILVAGLLAVSGAWLRAEKSGAPKEGLPAAIAAFNEGYDLLVAGKYPEAQVKFEKAIAFQERFAQAHNNLAFVLRMQGPAFYQRSLEQYARAIAISPRMPEPYAYRGTLYVLMGKIDLARRDYETLRALKPKLAEELLAIIEHGANGQTDLLFAASRRIYRPGERLPTVQAKN